MLDRNGKCIHKIPFEPKEKENALKSYKRFGWKFACKRYHVSKTALFRWKQQYDGTLQSLENKSHAIKSKHWNAHTEEELKHINDLVRRNPGIGLNELYGKLRQNYDYKRNPASLFRLLKRLNLKDIVKKKKYKPKKYDTPLNIGEKMQLDVKVVPKECKVGSKLFDKNFYQYTIIDECSRERFIYAYEEQCAYSTVDFLKRAFKYFGYLPKIIQTDNGQEFTYIVKTKDDRKHQLDVLCDELGIVHKLIKPRTPRHNGKVERSHRDDNERFYENLRFYSLDDLNYQMKLYLKRSNNIPKRVLSWLSPSEYRKLHFS